MSSKKTVIEEQLNGIWTFNYPPEVEMVVVSGDIHGAFREIVNKVACQYNIQNALVIIAGDCGFGFERGGNDYDRSGIGQSSVRKERRRFDKIL